MAGTRSPAPRDRSDLLRLARRRLLEDGELPEGLIAPELHASWQRSRDFGLAPDARTPGAPHASGAQLARALEQRQALVAHARPVMEFVAEQVRDSDSIVILGDAHGMLLCALGDPVFADRAARVALRPGAIWHEQWRGTNAIGTALAAGHAAVVHGAEHYLERNAFLTCAAAPIIDPAGRLLGALDISGDRRGYHRHTLGLVRTAARMVEHQLFETRHAGALQLHLHRSAEGLGTVTEGRLALSEDGWIIGANAAALELLGLAPTDIGATGVERALALDLKTLLGAGVQTLRTPRQWQLDNGQRLWLRVDPGRTLGALARARSAPSTSADADAVDARVLRRPEHDALAALDSGDATMAAVIARARRVAGKPIAVLLQGESGVGKELLARALHDSGPRAAKPFVAVNCAAVPESLIEAELFGYRAGAFTGAAREGAPGRIREADGGTLFLDEIGDMPLPMQARLLRVLQDRQVTPLGGGKPVAVDFALVCATHRQLRSEVEAGRFREDLYYRVNGLTLRLPSLRERSDLGGLIAVMLQELGGSRPPRLSPALHAAFAGYRWPGNLRQLSNVLRTACAMLDDGETMIDWQHLPDDIAEDLRTAATPATQAMAANQDDGELPLRAQADRCIRDTVRACGGNLSEAARRLGISRNTLYRRLQVGEAAAGD